MRALFTGVVCAAVLGGGVLGMQLLAAMKEPPAQTKAPEAVLRVRAEAVYPEDVEVTLKGYGEVRALNVVPVAAEVAGKVVRIHPNLEAGGLIRKGEVLFEVDPRDYEAGLADARAMVAMNEDTIVRLKKQYEIDRERLKTLERSRDLAKAEFDRVTQLFEQDQVGTQSLVEQTERGYIAAADLAEQLGLAVTLYPVRIREAGNALASAKARLGAAETSIERTSIKAPFNARVKTVNLEAGQYVAPGLNAMTLADDSALEISVPLDSREARDWLKFKSDAAQPQEAWFRDVEPVPCRIRWTEDKNHHYWEGTLNRIERFDQQTRTVAVAVRIEGEAAHSADADKLPLVAGMFCEVSIPGRTLKDLYRLASTAVNFEGIVYRSVEGRLKATPVERAFVEGEDVFISHGLNPGDVIITTRLVDPLENSLLDITADEDTPPPVQHNASKDGA